MAIPRGHNACGRRVIASERYNLAKSVFLSALALPREQRAEWTDEECRGDEGLRREVRRLLDFHEETLGESSIGAPTDSPEEPVPASLGEYRILGVLGRGGMGIVYRARRGEALPVALKVLRAGLLTSALLARFRREAAVLSRLDHPGIARFVETGLIEARGGLQPYFAMELVEGEDLRAWAARPRSEGERLEVLSRVCDAVQHAHDQGVVHRDLKPENILVRADGTPCVLDFGVARLTESDYRATTLMTSTGVLVGTIRYMSPEQAEARPGQFDGRSDVYTLGVIGYELMSGRLPYDVPSDSIHRALVAVLTAPPRPMDDLPGPRGRALEYVLGKALAKAPERRFASAAELAAELRRIGAGKRPLTRRPPRALNVPRAIPLLVVATIVAFAGGEWLGGRAWFRTGTRAERVDTLAVTQRTVALLDSARTRLHVTARAIPRVREAAGLCDSALVLLLRIPGQPWTIDLERFAWSLAMDAHLVMGELAIEPGEYEASLTAGEEMIRRPLPRGGRPVLPDSAVSMFEYYVDARKRLPQSAMAIAASELARYSLPLSGQRQALRLNREALDLWMRDGGWTGEWPPRVPGVHRFETGCLLNERGDYLAQAGALVDSSALVSEAIGLLQRALAESTLAHDPRALASAQHHLGFAWAVLARMRGSAADFDSAFSNLGLALAARRTFSNNVSEIDTRLALADGWRWRARTRPTRAVARRDLESAFATLDQGLDAPAAAIHPRQAGLLMLKRVGVTLDLATLARDRAAIDRALQDLGRLDPLFSQTTHPVVFSDLEIERARAHALRWSLFAEGAERDEAMRHLWAAAQAVPATEDPCRRARVGCALDAMAVFGTGRADLWYPVPSGPLTAAQRAEILSGQLRGP